jgi:hypothetical protein
MARYQPQGTRGRQPGGQLPARRQLPPPDPPLRQRALTAMLLGALSLIALTLGLGNLRRGVFVAVLALLFAAGAIWLGITASKKARRSGTARPRWAAGGVVLGCLGLAFSAMWLLVLAVFWPQLNTYYNCMDSANTVTAQQACHKQFTDSVGSEISVLQNGRLPPLSRIRVRIIMITKGLVLYRVLNPSRSWESERYLVQGLVVAFCG